MAIGEKLSSDIIVSTLINLSQKIRGLVFIPLITKILGTAAYGAYIQVLIIATTLATLSRMGFERALIRYAQGRSTAERGRLYISLTLSALILGSVFMLIVFMTASLLSQLFLGTDHYAPLFRIGSVLIPVYIAQVMAQNWYRTEMNVKWYSILDGIKTYLNVATVVIVVLGFKWGLFELVAAVVSVELLFATVLQIVVLQNTGLHRPTITEFDTYLHYSIPVSVTDFCGMFQDRADRLLIGFFLGANAVGIYSIAYAISKLLRMYTLPLRVTFFPEFSRLWEQDRRDECYHFLSNGSRYLLGLALPSVVGLYFIGGPLVEFLSTPEAAAQAPFLLFVTSLGIMFIGLEVLYRQLFYAAEETTLASVIRVIGTVVNIILNLALIPRHGIIGAAFATLLSYVLAFSILYALARRRFRIRFEMTFAFKALGATGAMVIVITIVGVQNIVFLLLFCPVIYGLSLMLVRGVSVNELQFLVHSIRR